MYGKIIVTAMVLASWASVANAVYVSDATGNGLQTILDRATTGPEPGVSSVDVNVDQVSDESDSYWRTARSWAGFTLVFERAHYDNDNAFGIYDKADPTNYFELFRGEEGPANATTLSIAPDGAIRINGIDQGVSFSSRIFGLYLGRPEPLFYSDSALNAGREDQMVAIEGKGDTINLPGKYFTEVATHDGSVLWGNKKYIIAWEDWQYQDSDKDFNDLVLYVRPIRKIPEPGVLGLLGLGLIGLCIARNINRNEI